ncbi:MAG: hypothetical protein J7M40_07190 [Planctomycetes bacterium]|nr:hypothetical protein [Planctomycetota bacterium]
MEQTFSPTEIEIGFHQVGYRIDKTASPMNLYTKWQISDDGRWHNPEPVDFGVLPLEGWSRCEGFDWNQ